MMSTGSNMESTRSKRGSRTAKIILLESDECFAIDSGSIALEHFRNRNTLAYELEQFVPLDAERMTIGIAGSGQRKGRGLILVADRDEIQARVNEQEKAGDWIALIAPKFLLEAQQWCLSQKFSDGVLVRRDHRNEAWDYLQLKSSEPVQWLWVDFDDLQIELSKLPKDTLVHVVGEIASEQAQKLKQSGCRLALPNPSVETSEFLDEEGFIQGRVQPWVDLRTNGIQTRYRHAPYYAGLLTLSGAFLILLLACITVLWIRCSGLQQSIAESDSIRSEKFASLFPNQSEPVDVPGRLQSELRKLELTRTELSKEPPVYSTFPVLVHFLNALPTEPVFRIDAFRLKSKQISAVEGSVKTLADFEALMGALRANGFEFAQPNVNQMKDGFSLRLERLTYVSKPPAKEITK
jgi:hypothetical protein